MVEWMLERARLFYVRPLLEHFTAQVDCHNLCAQVLLERNGNLHALNEGLVGRALIGVSLDFKERRF